MAQLPGGGGDPFDIAEVHGVGVDEVVRSAWDVVDAIHNSPELNITFPETHEEQMDCAMGFKAKSRINSFPAIVFRGRFRQDLAHARSKRYPSRVQIPRRNSTNFYGNSGAKADRAIELKNNRRPHHRQPHRQQ